MIIDKEMDVFALVQAIYAQQLAENNGYIDESRYFWKMGERVAKILKTIPCNNYTGSELFGIQVRFDIVNPYNLQLFKDVTR